MPLNEMFNAVMNGTPLPRFKAETIVVAREEEGRIIPVHPVIKPHPIKDILLEDTATRQTVSKLPLAIVAKNMMDRAKERANARNGARE